MKTQKNTLRNIAILCSVLLTLQSIDASAASLGNLNDVIDAFRDKSANWSDKVMSAASTLFWVLGTISLTWSMGQLATKKADIQEFFVEFFRFSMSFGFFYWLLKNATSGHNIAGTIISSLQKLGEQAAGYPGLSPSELVDIGLDLFSAVLQNTSLSIASVVSVVLVIAILLILASIAINMAIVMISEWILLYAGMFFLGFGGSSWTSDMAISYYKTVLGIGIQLFAMTLIAGVGIDLLTGFLTQMHTNAMTGTKISGDAMCLALVITLALWMITSKIPPMLSGIITGGGIGQIGNTTPGAVAGATMAAATMAGAALAAGASGMASGAANLAGIADAVNAAKGSPEGKSSGSDESSSNVTPDPKKTKASGAPPNLKTAMGLYDTGSRQSSSGNQSSSMGSRLASGIKSAAQSKAGEIKKDFKDKVSQTAGGQVANAIRTADAAAKKAAETENDNTLSAGKEESTPMDQSETDSVVNKSA